jgi:HK97 family phage prohead protease
MTRRDDKAAGIETRYFQPQIEMRSVATGSAEFRGYASAYDQWYDVAGGPEAGGWRERIAPRAGKMTLRGKPDVRLLVDHNPTLVLARTKSKTLVLEEDDAGLLAYAPSLDLRDPHALSAAVKVERGDVDSMSFAFRAIKQEWNKDYTERTIKEYDLHVEGSDASIVTFPANKAALATMRSVLFDGDVVDIAELRSAHTPTTYTLSLDIAKAIREQIRRTA